MFNPRIDNVFEYDKTMNQRQIREARDAFLHETGVKRYDLVIDLQGNIRSRLFRRGLAKTIITVRKDRLNKLSLVYRKKPLRPCVVPAAERYLTAAAPIGVDDDGLGLELWFPEEAASTVYPPFTKKSQTAGAPLLIALAPGAHHAAKRWPKEKFAELAGKLFKKYNAEIVLLGGIEDREICSWIKKHAEAEIRNCSGSVSIVGTARELDGCSLLISNDTGIMHIAEARQTPVAAIFGSTVPEFGFAPCRVPNAVIEKPLRCRPCTHIGRSECPKKHFDCMGRIEVDDVLKAAKNLMIGRGKRSEL